MLRFNEVLIYTFSKQCDVRVIIIKHHQFSTRSGLIKQGTANFFNQLQGLVNQPTTQSFEIEIDNKLKFE